MILFESQFNGLYNYLIHNFLEIEAFGDEDVDPGDILEDILPKYLYREQYKKCLKKFEELYDWTADKFYHEMTALHELILYRFLKYVSAGRDDIEDFDDIYFDKKSKKMITEASKIQLKEFDDDDFTLEDLEETFYDIESYSDELFSDLDFLLVENLYNNRKFGDTSLEDMMGINLDFYFELLPIDIQEQYADKHITLTGEITELLSFIQNRIHYGSLYKLFWENDKPINEDRIQVILENIMESYFYKQGVEITREALLGSGKVDFKLYKNEKEEEKILIEVKKANSSYLKEGYETQLLKYMESSSYKNAFYLIVCFTDEEYEKARSFIKNHVYTDEYHLYINISILDVRKKISASKNTKKKKIEK